MNMTTDVPEASDSKPEAKAEPNAETKAGPKPQANTGVAKLLNMSLRDLLVAGIVKDPEDAGRIIAAAIAQAEASTMAAKAPEIQISRAQA